MYSTTVTAECMTYSRIYGVLEYGIKSGPWRQIEWHPESKGTKQMTQVISMKNEIFLSHENAEQMWVELKVNMSSKENLQHHLFARALLCTWYMYRSFKCTQCVKNWFPSQASLIAAVCCFEVLPSLWHLKPSPLTTTQEKSNGYNC